MQEDGRMWSMTVFPTAPSSVLILALAASASALGPGLMAARAQPRDVLEG